eukprot:CAMPEP_0172591404 /NCGR_PEP_ID=MMETSP1068-20121228/10179_1 /TAXON_ID=35684 /ORGANISM="Pseudopedinella elastica, Strain CCMP716" /LENGTH=50 /DNA_ID=CAMNT_0013387841 /DNA_START=109 /DNA_END=258 /DNA_ORIENTATION=+
MRLKAEQQKTGKLAAFDVRGLTLSAGVCGGEAESLPGLALSEQWQPDCGV